jgi:hypothetical protein
VPSSGAIHACTTCFAILARTALWHVLSRRVMATRYACAIADIFMAKIWHSHKFSDESPHIHVFIPADGHKLYEVL